MEPSPAEPSEWLQSVIATCQIRLPVDDVPAATFAQRHLAHTKGGLRHMVTGGMGSAAESLPTLERRRIVVQANEVFAAALREVDVPARVLAKAGL
jgi:hypothetical protein